jgi:leader peptidase (prepilin peptidase) / N-methyltransferase
MFSGFFFVTVGLLFLFGLAVGSFLNVIIYRTIIGESWVWGRSHCEHCQKPIKWHDNIPLLSYFILQGKCRSCDKVISVSHPVIELLTGMMFVWWYVGGSLFFRLTQEPFHYIQPLFWLAVGLLLLVIFFADLRYQIIPDEAVFLLGGLTFFYRLALTALHIMQPIDFGYTILATTIACIGFWALWYFTRGKGMGFGDVKFMIPFGLLLGWPQIFVGLFVSFVSGAIVSVALIVAGRKKIKQTVPFGPFLIFGLIVTLLFGKHLLSWYLGLL